MPLDAGGTSRPRGRRLQVDDHGDLGTTPPEDERVVLIVHAIRLLEPRARDQLPEAGLGGLVLLGQVHGTTVPVKTARVSHDTSQVCAGSVSKRDGVWTGSRRAGRDPMER